MYLHDRHPTKCTGLYVMLRLIKNIIVKMKTIYFTFMEGVLSFRASVMGRSKERSLQESQT